MQTIKFAFLSLLLAAAFASCEKDEVLAAETQQLNYLLDLESDELVDELALSVTSDAEVAETRTAFTGGATGQTFSGDCFALVYPVNVEYPDGSTTTAGDADELKAQIRAYIADNGRAGRRGERPRLVFPLTIQLADGSLETLDNRRALKQQVRECRPDVEPCYTLVFPVSVQLGDETATVEDGEALRAAIRAYREASAGTDADRPSLVYPVTVASADGTETEVASRAEFRALRRGCRVEAEPCFTFVYPLTIEHRAGGQRTVESPAQLRRALSHANRRGRWSIAFPVSIVQDGATVEVESLAALREIRRACR